MLIETYSWFYLPVTVHKILLHGSQIISSFLVPIGQLSEDAQESRNKDIKRYRLDHTRKFSRTATNTDLLNRLLESSDPLISSLRDLPDKKTLPLSSDARELLIEKSGTEPDHSENSDEESGSGEGSGSSDDEDESVCINC